MPKQRNTEFTIEAVSVIALCFFIGMIGRMIPEHFPNLLAPMTSEFGWGRSEIASIFSVCALVTGLSGPFAGYLFDKIGPQKLFALGFCFAGGGLITAGYAQSLWQLYTGLGLFVGFATACCGNVAHSALISRWFREKLPLALSIIFSSLGAGSFFGLLISQLLISHYGWRDAEIFMGIGVLCLLPILLVLPWRKLARGRRFTLSSSAVGSSGHEKIWTLKAAVKTPGFWGFTAVFFITANGMYSIIIQSVTYLIEAGMPPLESSFNVGLTGIFIPVGMISCGYLLTRMNIIVVAFATYLVTIAGVLCLWLFEGPDTNWAIFGFILFFGLTMGTRGPVIGSLAAKLFRGKNFGIIFGSITTGGGLGAASGSFLSGWIYDMTLSYQDVFTFSVACLTLGFLPFVVIPTIRKLG